MIRTEATSAGSPSVRPFGGIQVTQTKPSSAQEFLEQAEVLHSEVTDLRRDTGNLRRFGVDTRLGELQAESAKRAPSQLLAELSDAGLAWRDIARILGVSVPAIQKWRHGANMSPPNRAGLAKLHSLIRLATKYLVDHPASWLEMPVAEGSDLTGIDLLSDDRFDVVLALLWPGSNGPEAVLDELLPGWRRRSPSSEFDTYVAHDGQVSIRLAKGGDTADNP